MKNTRVLVTGGSGFIGSWVVALLLDQGATVANLDFKPPTWPEHQPLWHDCDVRDAEGVRRVMAAAEPHYVIHLASDIDVTMKHLDDYETTVKGTRIVAEAARDQPALRRFIHISTQYVATPGILPKSETDFRPYTVYGEAKAQSEQIVRDVAPRDWLILRPTTIWGPRHPKFGEAIWKYLANGRYLHPLASAERPIMKCYGYVRNTAAQIVAFVEADLSKTPRRVFYLSDGSIDQDLWVDGFACAFTGKPAKRVPKQVLWALASVGESLRLVGVRFPMDMGRYFRMTTSAVVEMQPTFDVVGLPLIPMEQALKETIAWLETASPELFSHRQAA